MNSLQFFETHREIELDIARGVGVVREIQVIVETIVIIAETEHLMPLHSLFLPELVPLHLLAGLHEELHLHLFKLAHPEDELARYDFVTKCFTDLRDPKWYLHATGLLHVQKVDEYTLRCFGP